jgi:hypothetical protein
MDFFLPKLEQFLLYAGPHSAQYAGPLEKELPAASHAFGLHFFGPDVRASLVILLPELKTRVNNEKVSNGNSRVPLMMRL